MSVPARIWRNRSAVAEVRVNRGSTEISLALRLRFGWIAAHDQHHVGVLDVDPAVGHGPASERWSQT
jgi:hypothetical protein